MTLIQRLIKLHIGLFLFAFAIALMVNANIGVAPWDVFHQGLAKRTGLTFGQASILVGFVIVIISYFMKERFGYGTLSNMVLIGWFIDLIFQSGLVPLASNMVLGLVMITLGMVIAGFASFLYISAGFGAGPRDSMMVALVKKTGLSVSRIRSLIELSALVIGYLLGGQVGIGTLILAFGIGPIVQWVFKLVKFDVKSVKHQWF